MKLYSYYRSTAAYRVRIALNYKDIAYELIPINLITDAHLNANYRQQNPQARVPTLVDEGVTFGQSMAILEYLNEKYPEPPLLPQDLQERAWVRYFAQIIVSDVHPLNNSGVIRYLKSPLGLDGEQVTAWYHHWLKCGFDALEQLVMQRDRSGPFCAGDTLSMADVCLIPQMFNAARFNFSMQDYPKLRNIYAHCMTLPAFQQAQPEKQPDYDASRPNTVAP